MLSRLTCQIKIRKAGGNQGAIKTFVERENVQMGTEKEVCTSALVLHTLEELVVI